jgi:DNA-binding NtrC family response regulator
MKMPLSFSPQTILGSSAALRRILDQAAQAAAESGSLFLTGESGTGKDLLARAIHAASGRAAGPFVVLNAGALPDDILDREISGDPGTGRAPPYPAVQRHLGEASGGTLYLDDICRMPERTQGRLIEAIKSGRVLGPDGSSRQFTARLIAATHSDLSRNLREGRLRRDLYDLLSLSVIAVPPLRARDGDAARIAAEVWPTLLRARGLPQVSLSDSLLARLDAMPWPGNVRQLLNVLHRMALSPEVAAGHGPSVPPDVLTDAGNGLGRAPPQEPRSFGEIERQAILDAIERNGGSVQKAADELGLAASTIYRKLKSWQRPPTAE